MDSWILETSVHTAHNYGFMRAWGSIGFAIIVTVFGQVIDKFGWRVHFLSYGVIIFIVVIDFIDRKPDGLALWMNADIF
ncbi:hypothetical protein SAMN04515654_14017 [Halanaerobium congolense]|uniref:Major facilitator superfamily associated domain-containing protein n=1 Tax=Halanaerobium congolense TaxID=54121 RepID=A0A1G8SGP4_9FIRM|nr:MFS transporter [Halanaerobium congolense]SDJ28323.1 hypothetical protein SAMN04515654_14017 [Halanaerobium congolense]SET81873.1 hypothetical protein SAMN04515653_1412 [Halanaerobium congolense]